MLTLLGLLWALTGQGQVSSVKRDQEIVFFPSVAHRSNDGKTWELEIRGCVYKPDQRQVELALLREALGLDHVKMSELEDATLARRARLFMVDNKGGRRIVVRLGSETFTVGKSGSDGKFSGVVHLSNADVDILRSDPLPVRAVLPRDDPRRFAGEVGFVDDTGITVISDIDDTIKITQVGDRNGMLRNTFLEPFKPVPGMSKVYLAWAEKKQAQFDYVSASPWQLFLPLSEFVRSNGFPAGTFYLKNFRLKDKSFRSLFQDPEKYKPAVIEPLLKQFPNRHFVLVGDSGERDPEVYGALARQFPKQVIRIFIRDVTNEPSTSDRYKQAFHDVPAARWKVFRKPAEIMNLLDESAN